MSKISANFARAVSVDRLDTSQKTYRDLGELDSKEAEKKLEKSKILTWLLRKNAKGNLYSAWIITGQRLSCDLKVWSPELFDPIGNFYVFL